MSNLEALKSSISKAALGALVVMLPAVARAQDAVELAWEAPAECPQRDAVQARVRELAGPVLQNAERLRAEGRIVRVDRRYRLTLTVREKGELRERTMESESCVDLAGAAAVALGLLIRQAPGPAAGAGAGGTGTTPSTGSETAPPPNTGTGSEQPKRESRERPGQSGRQGAEEEPDEPRRPEIAPEYTDRTFGTELEAEGEVSSDFVLRAPFAVLDVGALPSPGFGVGGAFGVRWGGWRFLAGGRILIDQSWPLSNASGVGADVSRWQLEFALCRGWQFGRVEVSPCLSLGLDRVAAEAVGPGVTPRSQDSISLVPGVGGTLHFYLSDWVAIFASLTAGVETTRPHLVVEGFGEVGQVGPLAASLCLGPEWIF